eukprot:10335473-Alexandrium_andersonii.AAC.1
MPPTARPSPGGAALRAAPPGKGTENGSLQRLPIQGLGEDRSGPWRASDRSLLQLGVSRRFNFSQGVVQG